MSIRIDYGPIRELVGLAQAAGVGAARRQQEAGDIAFMQMVTGVQAQYAETAARLQASDRAFALQRAAMSRAARTLTPSARTPSGPIVSEMIRASRQQQQLEQLQSTYAAGGMSAADLERAKLEIMAGREVVAPTRAPKPVTRLSVAVQAVKHTERRNQRRIERQLTAEERKLREDPYADPKPQEIRIKKAGQKIAELEAALQASYQREDTALGVGIQPQATGAARGPSIPGDKLDVIKRPGVVSIPRRLTSAEEDALMDAYIAETKGDLKASMRLMAEREGQ